MPGPSHALVPFVGAQLILTLAPGADIAHTDGTGITTVVEGRAYRGQGGLIGNLARGPIAIRNAKAEVVTTIPAGLPAKELFVTMQDGKLVVGPTKER